MERALVEGVGPLVGILTFAMHLLLYVLRRLTALASHLGSIRPESLLSFRLAHSVSLHTRYTLPIFCSRRIDHEIQPQECRLHLFRVFLNKAPKRGVTSPRGLKPNFFV